MTDIRALDYSIQHALSRVPNRSMRNAWQTVGDLEKRVVASSIREYLEAERWAFRRDVVAITGEDTTDPYDAAIDLVVAECGDDPRAALKALLIANEFLGAEVERLRNATSTGFSRGRLTGDSKDKKSG
jgi:hypothetical protein